MLTGDLRSKIDAVWNAFWAGGIANPLEVIEQITHILIRSLGDAHTREENKANRPLNRRIFPKGGVPRRAPHRSPGATRVPPAPSHHARAPHKARP